MKVYLSLGSNLEPREQYLRKACQQLESHPEISLLRTSSLYANPALLPERPGQTWNRPFLNSVVELETSLPASQLLQVIHYIEKSLGRQREQKWQPREIDIDILLYGDQTIDGPGLRIPHPAMTERNFVLSPLSELCPELVIQGTGKTALQHCNSAGPLPQWMNIVNMTPDSFSDGGQWKEPSDLTQMFKNCQENHVALLDVGAESTRPGAETISPEEEWQRLQSFFEIYHEYFFKNDHETDLSLILKSLIIKSLIPKISIDTRNGKTAARACEAGARVINDVSGAADPLMVEVLQQTDVDFILMHSLSVPADKNRLLPKDSDPIEELKIWLHEKLEALQKKNISLGRIIFDPGIGFGKSAEQSLALIKNIEAFESFGVRLLMGHSRKSFMNIFCQKPFEARDEESLGISMSLLQRPVHYIRVHEAHRHARAALALMHTLAQ